MSLFADFRDMECIRNSINLKQYLISKDIPLKSAFAKRGALADTAP
jgi:hypothetical protein